jgi:energy-coupling factor transport system permease protein
MLTRNPAYGVLMLGVVLVHYAAASRRHAQERGWGVLLRIAAGVSLLVVPLNALSVHTGDHVLFTLPKEWPIVGGPITLEALVWGASSALGLLNLLILFATFNLTVDQAQILRLTPAFVYEAGLIVSIALAFIPQMMLSAQEIREAQLIRGHRGRRLRDMLPLVMALLTTALERSFQLAESMEARGFGNVRDLPPGRDVLYKGLTLLGLAGLLCGFFVRIYVPGSLVLGTVVALGAIGLLIAVFWQQGKHVLRSRYRRERRSWRDGVVAGCCLIAAGTAIGARIAAPEALAYDPYLALLPAFEPWLGTAFLALLAPFVAQLLGAPRVTAPTRDRS